jgi:hypothetical protein
LQRAQEVDLLVAGIPDDGFLEGVGSDLVESQLNVLERRRAFGAQFGHKGLLRPGVEFFQGADHGRGNVQCLHGHRFLVWRAQVDVDALVAQFCLV